MKLQELFTDPTTWCQRDFAQTSTGISIGPSNPEATCWCLAGGIMKCYPTEEYGIIRNTLSRRIGGPLLDWNDAPERTFEEVKALVEELDI